MITDFDDHSKGHKSHLEVIAQLRDYKRRRQSYRSKNKMVKKMSGYDVIREMYEHQMLYLKLTQESSKQIGDGKLESLNKIAGHPGDVMQEEEEVNQGIKGNEHRDDKNCEYLNRRTGREKQVEGKTR